MMLLLADSFSKLSTALGEKGLDSKTEWPKFAGDSKKFCAWYLFIMAQLSIHPWQELYDHHTNDVIASTTNTSLNGKLYAKLLVCLEGQALQDIVSRPHLRANGILLLQELVQSYRPKNVPEIIAAKTGEFWSHTKRSPAESIDSYYNRFHELLDDLRDTYDPISTKSTMSHFLFTLGHEFEPIQNLYRLGNLPVAWQSTHWPTLLILCRDFYNSVNPLGILKKNPTLDTGLDRAAHHKKVKQWFLNPSKYCKEIEQEQKKYPDKCIFHLSKSHLTADCNVKKECDKLIHSKKSSSISSDHAVKTGTLRHITEEIFEDAADVVDSDSNTNEVPDNDTNEDSLLYFAPLSKHYLRIVKNSNQFVPARHLMPYPVIADCGANYHMFKDKVFFHSLSPATGFVILGDGKTTVSIKGVGTIRCYIDSNMVDIPNMRYVPDLSESIYSLHLHIKTPKHGLESSFEYGLFIRFLDFQTKATIGKDDIYLNMVPVSVETAPSLDIIFSESPSDSSDFCRNVTQLTSDINTESRKLDNILHDLCNYYASVKTKRQLGLDVPAGFRRDSTTKQQFNNFTPPRKSSINVSDGGNNLFTLSSLDLNMPLFSNIDSSTLGVSDLDHPTSFTTQSSSPLHVPIIRSVDKPSSSLPKNISMTEDYLRACVGFRRVDTLCKHFKTLNQDTVTFDSMPADAVLDSGCLATIWKKN
jgi:hypothetical protein